MTCSEKDIQDFSLLIRQLLLKYKETRQELREVKKQLAAQEKSVKDMEMLATASMHDYDMLKAARIMEIGDGDLETTRKHVNKLIRDVDRCITLLTEQQDGL